MKRKLLVCALAMLIVFALPAMAFAAPSPSGTTHSYEVAAGTVTVAGTSATLSVRQLSTSDVPSSVTSQLSSTDELVWYGEITGTLNSGDSLTITFPVPSKYNGCTAVVYHIHNKEITTYTSVVKDGTVTISGITDLSTFAIAVDTSSITSDTAENANTSSTAPQTGSSDVLPIVVVSFAAALAALGLGFALRKHVSA